MSQPQRARPGLYHQVTSAAIASTQVTHDQFYLLKWHFHRLNHPSNLGHLQPFRTANRCQCSYAPLYQTTSPSCCQKSYCFDLGSDPCLSLNSSRMRMDFAVDVLDDGCGGYGGYGARMGVSDGLYDGVHL